MNAHLVRNRLVIGIAVGVVAVAIIWNSPAVRASLLRFFAGRNWNVHSSILLGTGEMPSNVVHEITAELSRYELEVRAFTQKNEKVRSAIHALVDAKSSAACPFLFRDEYIVAVDGVTAHPTYTASFLLIKIGEPAAKYIMVDDPQLMSNVYPNISTRATALIGILGLSHAQRSISDVWSSETNSIRKRNLGSLKKMVAYYCSEIEAGHTGLTDTGSPLEKFDRSRR